jgi:hypothetical protein
VVLHEKSLQHISQRMTQEELHHLLPVAFSPLGRHNLKGVTKAVVLTAVSCTRVDKLSIVLIKRELPYSHDKYVLFVTHFTCLWFRSLNEFLHVSYCFHFNDFSAYMCLNMT